MLAEGFDSHHAHLISSHDQAPPALALYLPHRGLHDTQFPARRPAGQGSPRTEMVERTKKGFLTKRQRRALEQERLALIAFINHPERWQTTTQTRDSFTVKYVSNYKMADEEIKD